jgi:hypothetical protein
MAEAITLELAKLTKLLFRRHYGLSTYIPGSEGTLVRTANLHTNAKHGELRHLQKFVVSDIV